MKSKKHLFLICLLLLASFCIPNSIAQVDEFDPTDIISDEEFTDVNSMTLEDIQSSPYGQVQIETLQEDFQSGFFHGTTENINLSYNGAQLGIDGEEGELESDIIPAPISFFALSLKLDAVMPKGSQVEVHVRVSPDSYNWGDWLLLGGDNFQYDYEGDLFYSNSQVSHDESYFIQYRIKLVGKNEDKPTIISVTIEFKNPGDIQEIIAEQEAREKEQKAFLRALKKVYLVPSIEDKRMSCANCDSTWKRVCNGGFEGEYQKIIAQKVKDKLSVLYDVQIFEGTSCYSNCSGVCSSYNYYMCQFEIGQKANNWGADVLVSFHTNATVGSCTGAATGTITFYECYNTDYNLAQKIHNAVVNSLKPLRDAKQIAAPNNRLEHWWNTNYRPSACKSTTKNCETSASVPCDYPDWHIATMPACLIESLFHDNQKESEILRSAEGQDAIAQGIANGIMEFFGDTPQCSSGRFKIGDCVRAKDNAWMRGDDSCTNPPSCSYTCYDLSNGDTGTVKDCGVYDGKIWWKIQWNTGGCAGKTGWLKDEQPAGTGWIEKITCDTSPATVSITSPCSPCNSSCDSSSSSITVSGTATDSGGSGLDNVMVLNSTNDSYGYDYVSGNYDTFSVSGILLNQGQNIIVAGAFDMAGNPPTADTICTIYVTYNPTTTSTTIAPTTTTVAPTTTTVAPTTTTVAPTTTTVAPTTVAPTTTTVAPTTTTVAPTTTTVAPTTTTIASTTTTMAPTTTTTTSTTTTSTTTTTTSTTTTTVVCQCPVDTTSPTGCISGRVTDLAGNPLANKTVKLKRRTTLVGRTKTDGNGCYQFTNRRDGTYKVILKCCKDCLALRKKRTITGGGHVNGVNFECQ